MFRTFHTNVGHAQIGLKQQSCVIHTRWNSTKNYILVSIPLFSRLEMFSPQICIYLSQITNFDLCYNIVWSTFHVLKRHDYIPTAWEFMPPKFVCLHFFQAAAKSECSHCGKHLVNRTALKDHIRAFHTGYKPYLCRYAYLLKVQYIIVSMQISLNFWWFLSD